MKISKKKLDRIVYNFMEYIAKLFLASLLFELILLFVFPLIFTFLPNLMKISGYIFYGVFIVFAFLGIILLALAFLYKFDKNFNENKLYSPKKYFKDYVTYENLINFLNQRFKIFNYNEVQHNKDQTSESHIYINNSNPLILEFIVIFRSKEYTKEQEIEIDNEINEFYKEYNSLNKLKTKFIAILIVDKVNKNFEDYINSIYFADKYKDILHVGISLKGKRIYISDTKDFFYKKRYRKITNIVINILDLKEVEKI